MIENVGLCASCPEMGLCVGPVSLDVQELHSDVTGYEEFIARAIVVTDSDRISNRIATVVPETYTEETRKGPRTVDTVPGDHTVRSDRAFESVTQDPDILLAAISLRAELCDTPYLVKHTSGFATTYERICKAASRDVIKTLVDNQFEAQ